MGNVCFKKRPVCTCKGLSDLPDEVILEIFTYLPYGLMNVILKWHENRPISDNLTEYLRILKSKDFLKALPNFINPYDF